MWTLQEMMRLKTIGEVHVSPGADRVTFTVREARGAYRRQIHVADARGRSIRLLTHHKRSSFHPRWSPDGGQIAFISDRFGGANLCVVPAGGGEVRQLTDLETEVTSFRWSPDGRWIAFTALDAPREASGVARVVAAHPRLHRLYVMSFPPGDGGPVTGADPLSAEDQNVGMLPAPDDLDYDWSPCCRWIVFSHTRSPEADDWMGSRLARVDIDTRAIQTLTSGPQPDVSPICHPDGRHVGFKRIDLPWWTWSSRVHVIGIEGGESRPLADTFDRRPGLRGWSADGSRLYYLEWYRTTCRLCALPLDGAPEIVYEPKGAIFDANLNSSRTAFGLTGESTAEPPEAHIFPLGSPSPKPITRLNAELVSLPIGRTEVVSWSSSDGLEIEGLLTYPIDYQPGRRVPLVLSVHGGPAWFFSQAFIGTPSIFGPTAVFAAHGYAVLRCNVRGSTAYGPEFREAVARDFGGMDIQDLLTGVDHVIEMGVADGERLGILGWSYGGFLAASMITKTSRFRAAIVGAGISNLASNAGTSDDTSFAPECWGGEITEIAEALCERSPALHAARVTTPTLILHGERDRRVTVGQGYELFHALRRQGCRVEMVVYPRMGHTPGEPGEMEDVMRRMVAWVEEHVGSGS